MELNPREKKLLMALGIIVVIVGIDFVLNSDDYINYYKNSENQVVSNSTKSQEMANISASHAVSDKILPSIAGWGRDPFYDREQKIIPKKARVKRAVPEVRLILKAISIGNTVSVAMINRKVVAVGDKIAGYRVKAIKSKQVVLVKAGKRKILKLP